MPMSKEPTSHRLQIRSRSKSSCDALRRAVGMPIGLPAFSWMVRIGAPLLMRTDPELALYGRYVVSKRLQDERFQFQFPQLRNALDHILK